MSVYEVKLKGHLAVAEGTMAFRFAKPGGFVFKAGQAIRLELIDPPAEDGQSSRTLSIVSAPFEQELVVATRMRDSAFKRALKALPEGASIRIDGPFGDLNFCCFLSDRRYSPGECCGAIKGVVCGDPDMTHVSTSFVQRQNLTMRMSMRRFIRLTNGFSRKVENHACAVALHYMYYNCGRIHNTLRVTPAMEAGIANHVWTLQEVASL